MCIRRTWQSRRVVYTKDVIAFSRLEEDVLLEAVPLADVTGIDTMKDVDQNDISKNNFESAVDFTHAFQIRTKKDGFNAGRKYFIQASSEEELTQLVTEISHVANAAVEREAARSRWERMQSKAREFYNNSWFQGVAAFLIVAVLYVRSSRLNPNRALISNLAPRRRTSARLSSKHSASSTYSTGRTAPRPASRTCSIT